MSNLDSLFAMLSSTSGVDNSYTPVETLDPEKSKTYNVNGAKMTAEPDLVVPVVYGRSVVAPNMINYYVEEGENETLNMLFGVCQGEIKGISNIKVGNNPISNYFSKKDKDIFGASAEVTIRKGVENQSPLDGFADVHHVQSIMTRLEYNIPYNTFYTTTITNCECFKIAFLMDRCFQVDDNGVYRTWYQAIRIEYRAVGETDWRFAGIHEFTIQTESQFKRYFKSDYLAAGQYEIKITKVSEDEDNHRFGGVVLYEIDEITTQNLIYPLTALLSIRLITTEAINNITCIVDGRLIRTPDIKHGTESVEWEDYYYDATAKCYKLLSTGLELTWDGVTYKTAFCGNPAWCLRDFLLNKRYGFGNKITTAMINDASFLTASQFADEGVLGLNGKIEKRSRLDLTIDVLRPVDEWINTFCSAMRAMPDFSNNTIRLIIEKAEDAVFIFNDTNIKPETFSIDYISNESIPNVLNLTYSNKDKNYQRDTISLPDAVAITGGETLKEKQFQFFGITRTSQVLREGKILLNKLRINITPIKFKTSILAFTCQEGDVFLFQSNLMGWGEGGRCKTGSISTVVKLDKAITLTIGKTYKIAVKHGQTDKVEIRTISTIGGSHESVQVSSAFSFVPEKYDEWYIYEDTTEVKYRVATIVRTFEGLIDVVAVNYDEDVYDYTGVEAPQDEFKYLTMEIPIVTNLVVEEQVTRMPDGTIDDVLNVSFFKPVKSARYIKVLKEFELWLSDNNGVSWNFIGKTDKTFFPIRQPFGKGVRYTVAVISITTTDEKTVPANSPQASATIQGWIDAPEDVTGFAYTFLKEIKFTWNKITDEDIAGYEIRLEDANWGVDNSNLIFRGRADTYTVVRPSARDGIRYYLKAFNTTGIYSLLSTSLIPVNPIPAAPSVLVTVLFQKVFIMWSDSTDSDLQGYEIWENDSDVWTGTTQGNEKLASKSIGTSAVIAVTYNPTYYRVRAYDMFGYGYWSNSVSAEQLGLNGSDLNDGSITATQIADNAITTPKIVAGAIIAGHIGANVITADKLNVACLSAISANMGCLTAGTLIGATIKTSSDVYRTEIDRDGLRGYDLNGINTIDLSAGSLKLYNPLCSDFYSYLDAGSFAFHTPAGSVPYMKRQQSGVACSGQTITLCQWYDMPSVILGIKRLKSYDPTQCESCQEWCVYADDIRQYNCGGTDFGWKFDIHAQLALSGGTREECIYLDAFDTVQCTGVTTCEIMIKELFQLWCHAAAPDTYKYGSLTYLVKYRVCGATPWCCCTYNYVQPHGTENQMMMSNITCQTINFGCDDTWEVTVSCSSLSWVDSGIASGGLTSALCCYNYLVDTSYYSGCLLTQSGSFNQIMNYNQTRCTGNSFCYQFYGYVYCYDNNTYICSCSCNFCITWGTWDSVSKPVLCVCDIYYLQNIQLILCVPSLVTVQAYAGGSSPSGTVTVGNPETVNAICANCIAGTACCYHITNAHQMCAAIGIQEFSAGGSPFQHFDSMIWCNASFTASIPYSCNYSPPSMFVCEEKSCNSYTLSGARIDIGLGGCTNRYSSVYQTYVCTSYSTGHWATKPILCMYFYAQACGNWCACRYVCYKVCCVCNCTCCYWYPVACGSAGCCEYEKYYSLRDVTASNCILDPSGEVSWLSVAFS
jgi:predicted phage tail protein